MSQRQTSQGPSKNLRPINLKNGNCSGAQFFIYDSEDGPILRKQISSNKEKLKEQYEWLKAHSELKFIPPVFNPISSTDSFSYDMPYYENAKNAHEALDPKNSEDFSKILGAIEELKVEESPVEQSQVESYFKDKLERKLEECLKNSSLDFDASNSICDQEFASVNQIISSLKEKLDLLEDGQNYEIHGDLTLENILINNGSPIFIDPNGENLLSTIEVEFGKLFQSLHSHYEELSSSESDLCEILECESRPLFAQLREYILENYGNESLVKTYFHEVIHIARLLPYKLKNQPEHFDSFLNLFIVRSSQFLSLES